MGQSPLAASQLLEEVRRIAERLVDDLRRAETLTRGWSNPELTETLVDVALSECLARLAQTGCWGEANRLPSGELWRLAEPLLEVGTLQHQARFKPRGYAGDYVMLARICAYEVCNDPLGRAFDLFFQRQAAPRAVRARTRQTAAAMAKHVLEHPGEVYRAVSVGSGPALDLRRAIELLPLEQRRRLEVTLLDLDPEALEYAQQGLEPLLPSGALQCLRENLPRLAQRKDLSRTLGTPDFLVCSGLFDYLADDAAAALLRVFWRQLAPGGLFLVGNFAPHNPSRAYMEWIGNWYLSYYRTAAEVDELALRAGLPRGAFSVGSEPVGIDLFLAARKQG
jgi:SAM-dependent methyltransferase